MTTQPVYKPRNSCLVCGTIHTSAEDERTIDGPQRVGERRVTNASISEAMRRGEERLTEVLAKGAERLAAIEASESAGTQPEPLCTIADVSAHLATFGLEIANDADTGITVLVTDANGREERVWAKRVDAPQPEPTDEELLAIEASEIAKASDPCSSAELHARINRALYRAGVASQAARVERSYAEGCVSRDLEVSELLHRAMAAERRAEELTEQRDSALERAKAVDLLNDERAAAIKGLLHACQIGEFPHRSGGYSQATWDAIEEALAAGRKALGEKS